MLIGRAVVVSCSLLSRTCVFFGIIPIAGAGIWYAVTHTYSRAVLGFVDKAENPVREFQSAYLFIYIFQVACMIVILHGTSE